MTHTKVLLVMPRDGIYRGIILGFNAVAAARGWIVDLAFPNRDPAVMAQGVGGTIDGFNPHVIVCAHDAWRFTTDAQRAGRILVGAECDMSDRGVPSVLVDNAAVGRIAAKYLMARGFRTFACDGVSDAPFAVARATAFRETIDAAGYHFVGWRDGLTLAPTSVDWVANIKDWAQNLPKPTGVLSCCDQWGVWLTAHCREANVRVPEDLAVVGVDDDELLCSLSHPPLSSVAIPWQRLGNEVAMVVEAQLQGQRVPLTIAIPPAEVTTRQSSDTTAVTDPDVAAALAFIRASADRPLTVPQIVRHVAVYRQKLEGLFREHLGRSIMDVVRGVHLEQAKRLLATTKLPMPEVARRSGFANASKLSIAFRKRLGTRPTDYRRAMSPRE